jgi:hypothetical protein
MKLSRSKLKRWVVPLIAVLVLLLGAGAYGSYTLVKHFTSKGTTSTTAETEKSQQGQAEKEKPKTYPYTLVPHRGTVFGAKIPKGWKVTENESGIDILNPKDHDTGAAGAVAVGWFGKATPDSFIQFMLEAIGAREIKYLNSSKQETVQDPYTGLSWVMRTKTFTFTSTSGRKIKAKASAGVLNGYGQFSGMIIAFQTTSDKWGKWAPTLERIAQSIVIINPSRAGGIDQVQLPTAVDLANDSSPLMEAWEYRSQVQEKTSHEFSDAIMGQESGLYSPSTGQNYTLPLNNYDPTAGGYHNPDNYSEILRDRYK